ncbi:hypothetical protein EVAR_10236_1 [Eumeta japonica]|uniref:Uncharacterized protein n=1 Tax=Eumeta variegata TaxID=151549 RepID=A0A4C1TG73_EUMVA|nr:hypothetical protein EVAR_10236_1 [Eumeta japonica]
MNTDTEEEHQNPIGIKYLTENFNVLAQQKADEVMGFGDDEPADLPKENALRNAKYTEKKKDLGLKPFSHPVLAVEDLKSDPKYSEAIHEISLNKILDEFKQLLTAVLTVAYSDYEDDNDKNVCSRYKLLLLNLMKNESETLPEFPEDHLFADMTTVDEDSEAPSTHRAKKPKVIRPIKRDLENIRLECSRNVTGSIPNDYANKDFANRLMKLCYYFLLWTAIVPTLFYKDIIEDITSIMTASSAISEEYFKDVKNHVFINIKNNPLVAFLKTHLNVLSGTMKLVAAMSKKPSKAIFDNSDTTVSNEDIETTSEAYETLKDAEEEQNEHQDSTASLECECPEALDDAVHSPAAVETSTQAQLETQTTIQNYVVVPDNLYNTDVTDGMPTDHGNGDVSVTTPTPNKYKNGKGNEMLAKL